MVQISHYTTSQPPRDHRSRYFILIFFKAKLIVNVIIGSVPAVGVFMTLGFKISFVGTQLKGNAQNNVLTKPRCNNANCLTTATITIIIKAVHKSLLNNPLSLINCSDGSSLCLVSQKLLIYIDIVHVILVRLRCISFSYSYT